MNKLMKGMLVAVIAASLVFGMASCGGGGGGPTAAAKGFYAAVEKGGDAKALEKYATKETAALMAMFGEKAKTSLAEYGKITDTSEKIDGDKAVVTLTFANGKTEDLTLIKDEGKWKVNVSK